jgi:protein-S-isoprenylcysteine O-methyltransferase Ste14
MVVAGPASLLEWFLVGAGMATYLVFYVGVQKFLVGPYLANRHVAFFQEMTVACAVIHCVSLLFRRSPGEVWTGTAIALYLGAIAMFLAAIEASRKVTLPRAFVTDRRPDRLITGGIYAVVRHPIYLAASLAWTAGVVGTHSPTAAVTAVGMITAMVVAARREDHWLAQRFQDEYRAYRRWWR